MVERAQREQFQSGASFMVVVYDPRKELPQSGMDLLVTVPTVSNISSSIDVNVKNRWSRSRNIKDLGNSLRMCLNALKWH